MNRELSQLEKFFIYRCEKGLEERGLADKQEYRNRLRYEMQSIINLQFVGYFFIVQDIVNWAKHNNIYVGPGRGSAAGCLCSYCLRITNLDPLRWDLLFERFLNPERMGNPDIDTKELTFEKFQNEILPSIDIELDIDYS